MRRLRTHLHQADRQHATRPGCLVVRDVMIITVCCYSRRVMAAGDSRREWAVIASGFRDGADVCPDIDLAGEG